MSESAIRAEIKSILQAVSGIGRVHDYIRLTKRWSELLAEFKDGNDIINAVMFERTGRAKMQRTHGEIEKAHVYTINCIYGLNDGNATGKTFQTLIEDIDTAIDTYEESTWVMAGITSHPDWGPMANAVGLQIDTIDHRLFGDVLCHFATCRLCVVEIVQV